jgi:toxin-antitoxin system PIN domain toxin
MDLPDINVLINAHREDAVDHEKYAEWLMNLANGSAAFALSSVTLGGFLRIVTNPRIFRPVTPIDLALQFCRELAARPSAAFIQPGARHWSIMSDLIERSGVSGARVSDAYLAALAIEHGCDVVTSDRDFARFPDVRWRHPLAR